MSKARILRATALILVVAGLSAAFIPGSTASAQCTPAPTSGDDYIVCHGTVSRVVGDDAHALWPPDSHAYGNDIIINYATTEQLRGGMAHGRGIAIAEGNDTIINYGNVTGNHFTGDYASSSDTHSFARGHDLIINYVTIQNPATSELTDIIGDYAQAGAGTAIAEGNDVIINYGRAGDLTGDRADSSVLAIASGDDTLINFGEVDNMIGDLAINNSGPYDPTVVTVTNGNDTIVNYGTVHGNIIGAGGNDHVTIVNAAPVYGVIDGGAGTDTLNFEFASADYRVLAGLESLANAIMLNNPEGGTVTIDGITFTWTDFESLLSYLRLLPAYAAWPIQVYYPDGDTITIWAPASATEGFKVAEFYRSQLIPGTDQRFDLPEGRDWYVIVFWVVDHFQVNVYDHQGILVTDRYLIY